MCKHLQAFELQYQSIFLTSCNIEKKNNIEETIIQNEPIFKNDAKN